MAVPETLSFVTDHIFSKPIAAPTGEKTIIEVSFNNHTGQFEIFAERENSSKVMEEINLRYASFEDMIKILRIALDRMESDVKEHETVVFELTGTSNIEFA